MGQPGLAERGGGGKVLGKFYIFGDLGSRVGSRGVLGVCSGLCSAPRQLFWAQRGICRTRRCLLWALGARVGAAAEAVAWPESVPWPKLVPGQRFPGLIIPDIGFTPCVFLKTT